MHSSQTGEISTKKTSDNVDLKTKGKAASKKRGADTEGRESAKKVKNEED